jgi:GNAT superfamily N-acetyltransferase
MEARVATPRDLDAATEILAGAFEHDPLWSWALPDRDAIGVWWRLFLEEALRFPWVWVLGDFAAVSVWIPPGESEMTEAGEARAEELVHELTGARAAEVLELMTRFEAAHPHDPPHYCLTLLGTDAQRRGNGYGMELLRQNLAVIDAEGMPAYLESTNPANLPRYESVGFSPHGSFERPDGLHTVTTMWREAASSGEKSSPSPARSA